jgi:hypothetical protein
MPASPVVSEPLPAEADDSMSDISPMDAGAANPARSTERRVKEDLSLLIFCNMISPS